MMQKGTILEPNKLFMLKCRCGSTHFTNIVDGTGVLAKCVKCDKGYKLESPGGVKVANA